ncbi:hypothetical protein BOTBODRAFT_558117 [Botryobasidium botryosum FD-172 SS1]|uniref:Uncharacterized protein n=1 Tax=Botryobasidium botryosum (strain FD-172 SS1) TaxID=930990 RepID=A0A067MA90_BOTB1|nr:hypothetical protein BOTBODRAFT_558117 [Botryobasidium botryosum FD-172 SS1]
MRCERVPINVDRPVRETVKDNEPSVSRANRTRHTPIQTLPQRTLFQKAGRPESCLLVLKRECGVRFNIGPRTRFVPFRPSDSRGCYVLPWLRREREALWGPGESESAHCRAAFFFCTLVQRRVPIADRPLEKRCKKTTGPPRADRHRRWYGSLFDLD